MEKWNEHDIAMLKQYYRQYNVPSDQIIKDSEVLEHFTVWFGTKTGKQFNSKEIADQLLKLRKSGKLPRLR